MTSEGDGVVTAWEDLALEKITALISRKAVAGADQKLAQVYLKRGALVPLHAHDGEELIYVLDGTLRLRLAGDDVVVRDGEVVRVPRRAPHQIEALADTFALAVRARQ
jgi:quercetin dioxygenase-like cupin family protein